MKPKCGIYYRVSTEEQDLKMQKANLPKYARQRGWQIVGKYEDNGISGSSIEARPGFKKMLDDLQSGKFQFLVVNETSRVTRADSAAERGLIIDLLMKHKITLSAPMEVDVDPNTAMGEKYLADAFWMAKQERRNIAKRMADGRCEKMKKGIPMYRGQRYGRRFWVEKHSSKNPEDWEVRWEITDQDKIDRIRKGGLFMLKTHCGWRKAAEHSGAISHKTLRQVILNQGGSNQDDPA